MNNTKIFLEDKSNDISEKHLHHVFSSGCLSGYAADHSTTEEPTEEFDTTLNSDELPFITQNSLHAEKDQSLIIVEKEKGNGFTNFFSKIFCYGPRKTPAEKTKKEENSQKKKNQWECNIMYKTTTEFGFNLGGQTTFHKQGDKPPKKKSL